MNEWLQKEQANCTSLGQQTEGLSFRGYGCCQFDPDECHLALSFGSFGFDAQPCGQVGLTQAERLVKEATGFARK